MEACLEAFSITDGSGVFISSLTLTIIVSTIVIVGIVLVAVIVTLFVLLSSCINRSTTTLEEKTYSDLCASYHINAELNNVQDSVFPAVCKEYMLNYLHGGQYLKDIEVSVDLAQSYLRNLQLQHDQKNAVILDIDEIALMQSHTYRYSYVSFVKFSLCSSFQLVRMLTTAEIEEICPVLNLFVLELHFESHEYMMQKGMVEQYASDFRSTMRQFPADKCLVKEMLNRVFC
ncbi:hypothetical protein KP509_05G104100 [Ceratopteris richardii]|uniref:Acid phosphatase n=1 Tax=Ceratopteris richardii TaxID=49495 RepID=A0A8T2UWY1_CERRI|nr:hypothetical protein KP509_05G104100 [Ceratopteris richardii]